MKTLAIFLLLVGSAHGHAQKVIDRNYVLANGLFAASTAADIAFTNNCLHQGTCIEANPFMRVTDGERFAIGAGAVVGVGVFSYYAKKHQAVWWIAPVVGSGVHGIGIWSSVRFWGRPQIH